MSSQNQLLHRFKLLQLRDLSFDDPSNLDLTQLCRLIECPVCREVPTPPIHNCVNGHFICGSCRGQLTTQTCAYCLSLLTQMRNYPLEALVSTPLVPCDYIRWGCTQGKLTLAEYEGHVQGCWAQIWRPGQISHQQIPYEHPGDPGQELATCRKCRQENSTRKVKCSNCEASLRCPTPLKLLDVDLSY